MTLKEYSQKFIQQMMASKTRPSKLCGFCIFHTETCEPLIEKWFVCYAFFQCFRKWKSQLSKYKQYQCEYMAKILESRICKENNFLSLKFSTYERENL